MPRSALTKQSEDTGRLSGSLRTLFEVGTLSGLTDGQLLERFRRGRGAEGGAGRRGGDGVHGPGGAPRADGPECLPIDPGRSA